MPTDLTDVPGHLLAAFSSGNVDAMRALLAEDMVSYVTNRDGGVDRLAGREDYLARIVAMDLPSADYRTTLTQPPVVVDDGRILLMVEVRAARSGRTLHNYAAHLRRVSDGRVAEWWMVEAKPAESDQFWS